MVVRKLFEICASKSVLAIPDTPAIREAGFIDNRNCIFVNTKNFKEKVSDLLNSPKKLNAISQEGYNFTKKFHTYRSRKAFIKWYGNFNKDTKLEKNFDPYNPLIPKSKPNDLTESKFLSTLKSARQNTLDVNLPKAFFFYQKLLKPYEYFPEACLFAGYYLLTIGQAYKAKEILYPPCGYIMHNKSKIHDPYLWGLFLFSLILNGKVNAFCELVSKTSSKHMLFKNLNRLKNLFINTPTRKNILYNHTRSLFEGFFKLQGNFLHFMEQSFTKSLHCKETESERDKNLEIDRFSNKFFIQIFKTFFEKS